MAVGKSTRRMSAWADRSRSSRAAFSTRSASMRLLTISLAIVPSSTKEIKLLMDASIFLRRSCVSPRD
jgi:hypothetical protein